MKIALACGGGLVYYAFFKPSSSSTQATCSNPSAIGRQGVVTTTNEWATKAGMQILEAGGNAVDAAVAIQFMLSLVQPQSTGKYFFSF